MDGRSFIEIGSLAMAGGFVVTVVVACIGRAIQRRLERRRLLRGTRPLSLLDLLKRNWDTNSTTKDCQ